MPSPLPPDARPSSASRRPSIAVRFVAAAAAFALVIAATAARAQAPVITLPAPEIAARAYLLFDTQSGQTLAGHNIQERVEPASLTKLMTAYLVFGALKQKRIAADQVVPVSQRAWKAEGSRMFIEPRTPVTVDELLHGMIIQSGNDASIALAEAVAGSEDAFAASMNREAQRLGMKNTSFTNSTGLPDARHYTSAHDLVLLAHAIVRDFPENYPLYAKRDYTYNRIKQSNRNRLLFSDPTVDGMKTGRTESAGYCLITSAKRGERRLISVVLGASSESGRVIESQKLLNHGFQAWETVRLYEKGAAVSTLQVWKGSADAVKAGFASDLFMSVPRGQGDRLKGTLESNQPLMAPLTAGQRLGTMKITLDGKPAGEAPVVALDAVPLGNIFARGWDAMRLLFK
jgi:D-alanyl-D-alanine carboxypeptidase (penicillin-binding protein 5/6)